MEVEIEWSDDVVQCVKIRVGDKTFVIRENDQRQQPDAIIVDAELHRLVITPGASNYIRLRQER